MQWTVDLHPVFESEFRQLSTLVVRELLAKVRLLETYGPELSRPHADTLNGSKHANMKELRFQAEDGVWRIAFTFDPERKAILLVAGDKSGTNEKRFHKQLIHKAESGLTSI
jgi:hypothetical protein